MATTITGSTSSSYWTFKLIATENSTSTSNNTSNLTVTAYIGRTSTAGASYMYGASISCPISVTGCSNQTITYYNSGTVNVSAGGWLNIGSKTFTVPHNADGSKTITISGSFSNNVSPASGSASGTMTLTKIPRQANITSAPDFTDEENPTIKYSNPAGNSVSSLDACISLTKSKDDVPYRSISKTGSSYTFELTDEERATLRNATPNSNKLTIYFFVRTVISGTTYYSTSSKIMTIVNGNPIFEDFDYTYADSKTAELTGDNWVNGKYVIKGYSSITTLCEVATAQKGASISYYMVEQTKTTNGDITITNYDKNTITVQAVDSRGNSTSITKTIDNFIEYEDITKGNLSLSRSDNGVGKFVTLNFDGTWWNNTFGAVQNTLTISYKYKKTTDSDYVTGTSIITPSITENNFSYSDLIAGDTEDNGFEIDESYDFVITITDELSSVEFIGIIGTGSPAIAIYKNKVSLGDKYDTSLGGIQLWGDIYINGKKIS